MGTGRLYSLPELRVVYLVGNGFDEDQVQLMMMMEVVERGFFGST